MSANTMDMDDEDDFYSPEEPIPAAADAKSEEQVQNATLAAPTSKAEELEEGEEEDEGGAMEEDSDDSVSEANQRSRGARQKKSWRRVCCFAEWVFADEGLSGCGFYH
jgi:hypothetical protein